MTDNQMSIFDFAEKFKIDKPIRLTELFAGYGSQSLALKYLEVPFESYKCCEWEVNAIKAYKALHFGNDTTDYSADKRKSKLVEILAELGISNDGKVPMDKKSIARKGESWLRETYNNIKATHNLVDITKAKGKDLAFSNGFCDIVTYSFPCFTADSLVLTQNGYRNIDEIIVGDKVLTHTNNYENVTKVFNNGISDIYSIRGMGIDEIKATINHKFYVREMYRKGHFNIRTFTEPRWKEVKDLTKKDYLGIAINQNSIVPNWNGIGFKWSDGRKTRYKNQLSELMGIKDFWWIIGRYIGDGWIRSQGGIIICCAKSETKDVISRVSKFFNYSISEERTVNKIHISLKELELFVSQFGRGAKNKCLTNTIIDLPINLLKEFLDGYWSADGCFTNGVFKASSVSRKLIYGMAQCVAKVYKAPYRIYENIRKPKRIIEGRSVNQNTSYELVFKKDKRKQDKAFYEDGYIWFPIKTIQYVGKENVYDIEVEKDHSFTVQNTMVHNCQDLSLAGNQKGMDRESGTRSGLLWEVERILNECNTLPKILVMENVTQVHGTKNKHNFDEWCKFLESKGYKSFWKDLNGKCYCIPQNRDRTFMVSILDFDGEYSFPKQQVLRYKLKDILEPSVDEKYYISNAMVDYYTKHTQECKEKGNGFAFTPTDGNNIGRAVTTRAGGRMDDSFIKEAIKLNQVGILINPPYDKCIESACRVYDSEGLAPTINTCGGGNTEPKVATYERFYKQAFETMDENDCKAGDTIDAFNKKVNTSGISPTITTRPEGFKTAILPVVEEPTALDEQNKYIREDGCVGTLTTDGSSPKHNNRVIEPTILQENEIFDAYNKTTRTDGICETITANGNTSSTHCGTFFVSNSNNYRIRKLTPTECLRLMAVKDTDIEKLKNAGLSNSALYKLAGNSIIVTCLMGIFGQIIDGCDWETKINELAKEFSRNSFDKAMQYAKIYLKENNKND